MFAVIINQWQIEVQHVPIYFHIRVDNTHNGSYHEFTLFDLWNVTA